MTNDVLSKWKPQQARFEFALMRGDWNVYLGVSIVMGIPKNGWFIRDNPIKMVLKKERHNDGNVFLPDRSTTVNMLPKLFQFG